MTETMGEFVISDEKQTLDIEAIYTLLRQTYWARKRSFEAIQKAIANCLCFGVYHNGAQVGFARCLTDYATVYCHHNSKG